MIVIFLKKNDVRSYMVKNIHITPLCFISHVARHDSGHPKRQSITIINLKCNNLENVPSEKI